ncbi:MAG: PIG-L family deacetylase [Nitrospirae bacterium]|nr:PIG-L family deacetylase [Nitrospirota bacterium]
MKNLIIAAHPDDEILGCGGLIHKSFNQGDESYVLILTGGAETRYDKEMEKALRENAVKANFKLGTKEVFFEDLPNQQLDTVSLLSVTQIIEKYIDKILPEAVFTHHIGDLNRDHQIVSTATMTAVRPIPGQIVKKVYSYFVASSSEYNLLFCERTFAPNTFLNIRDEIDCKVTAMECYQSECRPYPHPRSGEALRSYAKYWGLSVGVEYAEPFVLVRDLKETI